ncbi:MAG: carbohydrate kinase [Pseudonocardiales bacterium]
MIVVCGEALVDLVPGRGDQPAQARPGGSPANVAVGLGRLGVPVSLLARLSRDGYGDLLRGHLSASHVDLSLVIDAAEPSTVAQVSFDGAGDAEYSFIIDTAADGGWQAADLPDTLPAGAALHLSGSLALGVSAMGEVFESLLRREAPLRVVSFDPNVRPALITDEPRARARLERWLGLADIVKASLDDVHWIAPHESVADVARRWRSCGASLVVITRGADGVHALGPNGSLDLPGQGLATADDRAAGTADTIGAGDAFTSGLLAALGEAGALRPAALSTVDVDTLRTALAFAQDVAGRNCRRAGADPPWRSELAAAGPGVS